MPDKSTVYGRGLCPQCGKVAVEYVRIQWGSVPNLTYSIGKPVIWVTDNAGNVVPPFTFYGFDEWHLQWNCGSPEYKNVIVFDWNEYDFYKLDCPHCGEHIAGGAAVVRDGAFAEILALREADVVRILGDHRGKADIVIIRENGTYWPREDWYDHVVRFVGYTPLI